ncbi:unnamed protein product [Spirodela intermedia]|uniref:START domain-containing protein n=1 Tax=Spirodela intermedia TaxID=51605 RepID=A0A7I8IXJ6_SPIIN|nr:unnamed protein product [Spirodela intermedia]CAA6662736.1 unnamed protein product [Spirodela intermedia]
MRRPTVVETLVDLLLCAVPIWVAVMIGLVIGWSWRPRWTGLVFLGLRSRLRVPWFWTFPLGFGARRLWFAFTALSAFSVCRRLWANFNGKGYSSTAVATTSDSPDAEMVHSVDSHDSASHTEDVCDAVTEKDLERFLLLLDNKAGDAVWHHLMERTTQSMTYQAWRHEPEQNCFEDATPEIVRDFFWDDDFRLKWDPMLSYFELLEEFPCTGTSVVHWIKKFPFFCSDREYIIGRRIWESGKTYYCVTKGIQRPSLQKKEKPRRVDLYFSSWRIRAVESCKQDGQQTACEVTLVHYEDMGIPKDVAKVGKLQSGVRAYQLQRKMDSPLSRSAQLAQHATKIPHSGGHLLCPEAEPPEIAGGGRAVSGGRGGQGIDWKWVAVGGAIAVVCGVKTGVIGKTLLLGAARRLARR